MRYSKRLFRFIGDVSHHTEQLRNEEDGESSNENSHRDRQYYTFWSQVKAIIWSSWIVLLLVPAIPTGFVVKYTNQSPVVTFAVNFVAIIPLGRALDIVTEEMTIRLGGHEGTVIVITLSNAVQLVITIIALIKHQSTLVKTSLVGAVLSNTLLIVGIGFFLGGIDRPEQRFDPMTTGSSFNELVLSVAALIIPTAIHTWSTMDSATIATFSRAESILLFLSYACYIIYCYKSHSKFFKEPHQKAETHPIKRWNQDNDVAENVTAGNYITNSDMAEKGVIRMVVGLHALASDTRRPDVALRRTQSVPQSKLSSPVLAVTLVTNTVLLGFCTTFAVDSIDGLTQETVLTQNFIGLILLPLLSCNLHAIKLARKDKLPQSFAISISSSIQLLLAVLPLAVVIAWTRHDDTMNLLFDGFQVVSLAVSVLILKYITADGKSNWLEGLILIVLYAIIALNSWFSTDLTLHPP